MRLHAKIFSYALMRDVSVVCEIPYEFNSTRSYRSIWALHCAMRDGEFFFENLGAASIAKKLDAVIIAPSLGNNFFINSVHERQADCLEELFSAFNEMLPLASGEDNHSVMGISMGGFGALAWALRSGHFYSTAAISGIFNGAIKPDQHFRQDRNQKLLYGAFKPLLTKYILGENGEEPSKEADFTILFANAVKLPKILLYCGEEDYLSLPQTMSMAKLARENNCQVKLAITPGGHDEEYWAKTFSLAAASLFSGA